MIMAELMRKGGFHALLLVVVALGVDARVLSFDTGTPGSINLSNFKSAVFAGYCSDGAATARPLGTGVQMDFWWTGEPAYDSGSAVWYKITETASACSYWQVPISLEYLSTSQRSSIRWVQASAWDPDQPSNIKYFTVPVDLVAPSISLSKPAYSATSTTTVQVNSSLPDPYEFQLSSNEVLRSASIVLPGKNQTQMTNLGDGLTWSYLAAKNDLAAGSGQVSIQGVDLNGNTVTRNYAVNFVSSYTKVKVIDDVSQLECQMIGVTGNLSTTSGYFYDVDDFLCADELVSETGVGSGDIRFFNGLKSRGAASKACKLGVLSIDGSGTLIAVAARDTSGEAICIRSGHEITPLPDTDGDGLPNRYDLQPFVAFSGSTGLCGTGTLGGRINISGVTYNAKSDNTPTADVQVQCRNVDGVLAAATEVVISDARVCYEADVVSLGVGFRTASTSTSHVFKAGKTACASAKSAVSKYRSGDEKTNDVSSATQDGIVGHESPPSSRSMDWYDLPETLRQLLEESGARIEDVYSDVKGKYIVFASDASLVPGDVNGQTDVYLYSAEVDSLSLVSANLAGRSGNGVSDQPRIDGMGGLVVFRSEASDLVVGLQEGSTHVFIYDLDQLRLEAIASDGPGEESSNPTVATSPRLVFFERKRQDEADASIMEFSYDWPAEGVDTVVNGVANREDLVRPGVSADARYLAFIGQSTSDDCRLHYVDLHGGRFMAAPCPMSMSPDLEFFPFFLDGGKTVNWVPKVDIGGADLNGWSDVDQREIRLENPLWAD